MVNQFQSKGLHSAHCTGKENTDVFSALLNSEEAEALAKKLKLRFYRTSVKEDLNVTEGKGCCLCTDPILNVVFELTSDCRWTFLFWEIFKMEEKR